MNALRIACKTPIWLGLCLGTFGVSSALGQTILRSASPGTERIYAFQDNSVRENTQSPVKLKDRYKAVRVAPFEVREGTQFPADFTASLQADLVKELSGVFKDSAASTAPAPTPSLLLEGTVLYYDPGNRLGRYLIGGNGPGNGYMIAEITLRDADTKAIVASDQVFGANKGGMFGGSAKNITKEFAKSMGNVAKIYMETFIPNTAQQPSSATPSAPATSTGDEKIVKVLGSDPVKSQAELNAAAAEGYRIVSFAPHGLEFAEARLERTASPGASDQYRVLRAVLFGNLEKDMAKAAGDGFRYRSKTLSWLSGDGMMGVAMVVMEKPSSAETSFEYRMHAPMQAGNAPKDVAKSVKEGFEVVGTMENADRHVALMERKKRP